MGILDGIKDFYSNLEGKYYDFLDAINQRVPVYEIIDPVDKVVPSFALLILAALLAAALVLFGGLNILAGPNDTLTVSVQGIDGSAIPPPVLTAIIMALAILVKILPFTASVASF